jgi:hypothetical protein
MPKKEAPKKPLVVKSRVKAGAMDDWESPVV